ncbi:snoRNA-binding rRNA-processing protein [Rhizophlyctis rosea]|uniref:SnoRNA-binding rRNA-processing protein n=1 Tax=Rhizophlyctis rosea TaxID=64517 RepID=A0AAD5SH87_9FUNG|nr:snoRNA-binding rRNA-processing protein [Rhizophlyctis rosea]
MASTEYKRLEIKKTPRIVKRPTESWYWKKFKSPVLVKEYASISSINFSPVAPFDFAVTSSTRVQVYGTSTCAVKKSISRFKDTAYSGHIRSDGKLLVAGDATGLIQLFDLSSRAILRTLEGHDSAVHVARFSPNYNQILSASDDRTVRIWDVPSQTATSTFTSHTDHIRTAQISPTNSNLILSGSYDHTIRLFDLRTNTEVMSMSHDAPVESILVYPGGSLMASAGGNTVKIWDLLGGGRVLQTLSNHQKTITCMAFDGNASRLLTGSLDHHVKVYNVQDYKVTYSSKYPAPVQSIAVSPNDTHLVVGMTSGLLSIRQRVVKTEEIVDSERQKQKLRRGTHKYFVRGSGADPAADDITIESRRRKRLAPYDKYLKSFQYANALDYALAKAPPVVIVSLLEELIHRSALRIALAGRDDRSLEPIITFLMRRFDDPRWSSILLDVTNVVLDLYENVLTRSPLTRDTVMKLRQRVIREVNAQEQLQTVLGLLDAIFAVSR